MLYNVWVSSEVLGTDVFLENESCSSIILYLATQKGMDSQTFKDHILLGFSVFSEMSDFEFLAFLNHVGYIFIVACVFEDVLVEQGDYRFVN